MCPLTDDEFALFLSDPFDPEKRSFQYSASRSAGPDYRSRSIITSVGPDGRRDIDLSSFDVLSPNWGLGDRLADQVYDPTNGALSTGDIVADPNYPSSFLEQVYSKE